ncbi:MAG: hypothetical protein ACYS8W_11605 [Planctomycetota bacterium]|jgi:hypothetical protein
MNRSIKRHFAAICILAAVLFLTASLTQGGCGKDKKKPFFIPPPERPDIGGVVYNAAMSVGDLLTYEINTSTLEYSVLISEGQYAGFIDCGSITATGGFGPEVYTSDDSDKIVLLPGKMILVSTLDNDFIVGVPQVMSPYTVADITGIYNFVHCGMDHETSIAYSEYGTLQINLDGTWGAWPLEDAATTLNPPDIEGSWTDRGNGIVDILGYITDIGMMIKMGNLMVAPSGNGNIIVLDKYVSAFGTLFDSGVILCMEQQSVTSGLYDGIYDVIETGEYGLVTATLSGTSLTTDSLLTITYDAPWTGMIYATDFYGILSQDGIFFGTGGLLSDPYMIAGIIE